MNPAPACRPIRAKPTSARARVHTLARQLGPLAWCTCAALLPALPAHAQDAAALTARHAVMSPALARNDFQRPIALTSIEQADGVSGDVYARIELPFGVVSPALQGTDHWCQILILHLNVKRCRGGDATADPTVDLLIGRKHDQPIAAAYHLALRYEVVAARADYLRVVLSAVHGPLGTHGYLIVLEGVPLDARRSFLHLSYAYGYGSVARLAMQGYLATIGRDKVGFSVVGRRADGTPVHVGGTRGVVERNTMRYYLAIEAHLGALSLPAQLRPEKRLSDWYTSVAGYPLQLHDDLEREDYLRLKRGQIRGP